MTIRKMMISFVLLGFFCAPFQVVAGPPSPLRVVEETGGTEELGAEASRSYPLGEEPSRMTSGATQAVAGVAGGAVTGLLGLGLGLAACGMDGWDRTVCALSLGLVGAAVGTTGSVWATGEWLGWDGSLLATIGGFVLGAGVGALLASQDSGLAAATGVLLMPVGAAAGYQLSADWKSGSSALLVPKARSFPIVYFEF